jgi:ATP-dependent helicase/nuclease subunit A
MEPITLSLEQREALATGGHLVVRANAGSGKTFVLALRIVWLLVEHGLPFDRIVAITFTTKAAAEMRARVRRFITDLIEHESLREGLGFSVSDDAVMARLMAAQRNVATARISTFHSLAASLVRSFGADVGVDPMSAELTERDASTLLSSSVRSAIRERLNNHSLDEAHDLLGIANTEDYVRELVASGEQLHKVTRWFESGSADILVARAQALPASVAAHLQELGHNALADLRACNALTTPAAIKKADALVRGLGTLRDSPNHVRAAVDVVLSLRQLYTKEGTALKSLKADDEPKPLPGSWPQFLALLADGTEAEASQARLLKVLHDTAVDAHERFAQLKRRRVVIDYDDMMAYAVAVLERFPAVAGAVRANIQQVLVDEFQDTNPLQYQLLQLLVPDLLPGGERGPELFAVGDDKQSIYGFRDADVRLFREVDAVAQRRVGLQRSYRMTPPLARHVNAVCEVVFDGATEFDVPYAPLTCERPEPNSTQVGTMRIIHRTRPTVTPNDDEDEGFLEEADEVVQRVLAMLDGRDPVLVERKKAGTYERPQPSDVGILVRKRDTVTDLARRLQAHHIPVQVHGGRAFFSRPEVADLRNLLIVLSTTSDALALASVLRSPLFQCSDADLTAVAAYGKSHRFSWEGLTQAASAQEASPSLASAYRILEHLRSRVHGVPVDRILLEALELTRWHATTMFDPRGQQAIDNVNKFIELVRLEQQRDGASLHDVIAAVSIPDGADNEAESATPHGNAVQVMTLHAAKGLEFPIVILCGISQKDPNESVQQSDELGPTYPLPAAKYDVQDPTTPQEFGSGPSHVINKLVGEFRAIAETRRLIYVALTRAKDHVLIVMHNKVKKDGAPSTQSPMVRLLLNAVHLIPPAEELPPGSAAISVAAAETPLLDRTAIIPTKALPQVINLSGLVPEPPTIHHASTEDARARGVRIHEAIAVTLSGRGLEAPALDDDVWQRFVQARPAWNVIPADAWVECEWVAMLDATLVVGRPDVVFQVEPGSLALWDWKVIDAPTAADREVLMDHYRPQLAAYAWLLFTVMGAVERIQVRLLAVPNAVPELDSWSVAEAFTRADLPQLEALIRSAIAVPAATADAQAH